MKFEACYKKKSLPKNVGNRGPSRRNRWDKIALSSLFMGGGGVRCRWGDWCGHFCEDQLQPSNPATLPSAFLKIQFPLIQKWTWHAWILSRGSKSRLLINVNNSRFSCYVYVSVRTLKIDLIYIASCGPWCPWRYPARSSWAQSLRQDMFLSEYAGGKISVLACLIYDLT